MGLMPAHRGGERLAWSLKEIVIAPGNPARGLDAHQGAVLLHDGETGELRALLNASRDHRDPHGRGLGGRDARARAARRAAWSRSSAPASRRARTTEAMRAVLARRRDPHLEPRATAARAEDGRCASADVVCTCTSAARADPRGARGSTPGTHVNAVGSSVPTRARARRRDDGRRAALFVDRRESTLNESGDLLLGPAHRRGAHPRRARRGARRRRIPGRTDDDELTVFKSLGLAVEDLAAAELSSTRPASRASAPRSTSDRRSPRSSAARETIAGAAIRTPLVRLDGRRRRPRSGSSSRACSRSARSRSAAPSTRSGRHRAERAANGRRHGERRQHGAGRRLGGARARRPGDDRRARARAADEARRDRAARRHASSRCRTSAGGRSMVDLALRRRRGPLRPPGAGRARDGRQRHDRARARRGPARRRTRCSCPGAAAGSSPGSRARSPRVAARDARLSPSSPRRARRSPPRSRRASRASVEYRAVVRRRRRRARSCCRRCGSARGRCSPAPSRGLARRRPPPPSGCSPSARAWSRRAPARSRSRPRSRARAGGGRIVCIVSGGNIDADRLATILARRDAGLARPSAPAAARTRRSRTAPRSATVRRSSSSLP